MSKIIVDAIQKNGGPKLKLPTVAPTEGQVLSSNISDPNQLEFSNKPANLVGASSWDITASPFIFSRHTRYQNSYSGNWGYTSELGQWYSGNHDAKIGTALGRTPWGQANGGTYNNYSELPSIQYLSSSNGNYSYLRDENEYADSSSRYNYPDALLSVVFVKNTTGADITRPFYFSGSSYWNSGYEGACISTAVPDATNAQILANPSAITTLSQSDVWSYTSNTSNFNISQNITVPAGKTILIFCYSSGHYYTSSNGYIFFMRHELYNFFSDFLTTGLEVDVPRTIKALQNPNKLSYTDTAGKTDIWK